MELRDWFQYLDKDKQPYNPIVGDLIVVDKFFINENSNYRLQDWKKEEWLIRSALVSVDFLECAAKKIDHPDCLRFITGWDSDGFNFGDYIKYGDFEFYPLVFSTRDPITEKLNVEMSRNFSTYHALQKRNEFEYYHPIDNILVVKTGIDSHNIHEDTPSVAIHRDYLRDFLAATNMGLIISVVADRFANSITKEDLALEEIECKKIDDLSSISTNICTPNSTYNGFFCGRSIFRRSFIIKPYERPKTERTPWYYFGENSIEEADYPKFIINNEGEKKILPRDTYLDKYIGDGIGTFGYLYFRPEVLQKFLQVSGYSVFFHMRNWGVASLSGDRGTIDVGINSQGFVNAFAPDIADLNPAEQAYWASFSSLPSGEVCEEMFETRMQQNPPHSPGVTELIENAISQLSISFKEQFSIDIFTGVKPSQQELYNLSVGLFSNKKNDIFELAEIVYKWIIETMQVSSLRCALNSLNVKVDNQLRQIKLLEKILMAKGLDEEKSRLLTAPLVSLNQLRIGSTHIGSPNLEEIFKLMGTSTIPEKPREAWNVCVDAIENCLNLIANTINSVESSQDK